MPRNKGADGVPSVIREVTVYLPEMIICGCPSFNKRTEALQEALWRGERSLDPLLYQNAGDGQADL